MSDFHIILDLFKGTYGSLNGILAIEDSPFLKEIAVLYDRNTFNPLNIPLDFNAVTIRLVDVHAQISILSEIKESMKEKAEQSSILDYEINKFQTLLNSVVKNSPSSIIFLDIDGVLNSTEYWDAELRKQESDEMSDAQIMLVAHWIHLDPSALLLLNELVDRSKATVVLSSTWRGKYSPVEITKMMQERGATFTVVDSTPALHGKVHSSRIPRGKEIKTYLETMPIQPKSFVILDDHDDMLDLKQHLVHTNVKVGLTSNDVDKALKILNGEV